MGWIGDIFQAVLALDNDGKAWLFAILAMCGSLAALIVAWRMGYFRSHAELVQQQRDAVQEVKDARADIASLDSQLGELHARIDVLAVDQAGVRPILAELHRQVSEMSRTTRRLSRELARMGGATDTLLQMMQREPTPPGGVRPLGHIEETPDPDDSVR
jgi:hypothetical protein